MTENLKNQLLTQLERGTPEERARQLAQEIANTLAVLSNPDDDTIRLILNLNYGDELSSEQIEMVVKSYRKSQES